MIGQAIGGVVQGFLSLTDSPWHIIPLQGWLTMLIVGLALAPYFAFRNVHKGLMAIRNARPALSIRSEPYNRSTKGPTYTHIDIMNKPECQT